MFLVYPSGPMAKAGFDRCAAWHRDLAQKLGQDFLVLSQLRGQLVIVGSQINAEKVPSGQLVIVDENAVVLRDMNDVLRSDLVFVNLLGATEISIGTHYDVAWAFLAGKTIVLVIEDEGNPNDYPFLRKAATVRVNSFELGVAMAKSLILPGLPAW